jgi:hypothetical protein
MKNLGKILLSLFIPMYIFASVVASVDSTTVTEGEYVTLNLKISGKDIKKPNIATICGVDIASSSSQTSIVVRNGKYEKNYILSYQFMPLRSCTIEPISLEIDSKVEKTNPINIKLTKQKQDKNSDFLLLLISDKKEVYVGESFKVDVVFKQKDTVSAVDSEFKEPKFEGFWIKNKSKQSSYKDANYNVVKLSYTLSAQRDGNQTILPAKIAIAQRNNIRDSWGMFMQDLKWKTYYSNILNIQVKPLPSDVKYIGDFKIKVDVDKTTLGKNEPLNLTLKITGDGNLEDMKSFKPHIDGVTIYDENPVIKNNQLTQKMAFVSDNNFTIKPFILKYFDTKSKKLKTLKTKEIKVTLHNTTQKHLVVKKSQPKYPKYPKEKSSNISYMVILFVFLTGIVVGVSIMLIKPQISFSKSKKIDIKDEKLLFVKLLPYKDDSIVKQILDKLEENIYHGGHEDIDKKQLKQLFEKYGLI